MLKSIFKEIEGASQHVTQQKQKIKKVNVKVFRQNNVYLYARRGKDNLPTKAF